MTEDQAIQMAEGYDLFPSDLEPLPDVPFGDDQKEREGDDA